MPIQNAHQPLIDLIDEYLAESGESARALSRAVATDADLIAKLAGAGLSRLRSQSISLGTIARSYVWIRKHLTHTQLEW